VTFGGQVRDALDVGTARGAPQPDPCLSTSGAGSGVVGPIGIIRQVGCEANAVHSQGWVPLLTLVAEISADLAIVNLLPIPALDGGRLLFVLIALVTRRRLRPEVEGMAHALGMAALLTLIFVVSWHDVMNLINNRPVF
jgi:regulator of sigma E protease